MNITQDALRTSADKYRRELLMMPVQKLAKMMPSLTIRPGIVGKETVGELVDGYEFGPYDPKRIQTDDSTISARVLETYFGSVIKEFDPNKVVQSIYGSLVTKGDGLKNIDITLQVLVNRANKLGEALYNAMWKAVRNNTGTKTVDLFNGYDTITATEKTAGNLSADNGNLKTIEAVTKTNAYDVLTEFYKAADDMLKEQNTLLFVPSHVYEDYCTDYKATTGAVPYNNKFEQPILEGTQGRCTIVPLANKSASPYIHLTTKSNMLLGFGNISDKETILIERFSAFLLQFVATLFIGVQFESINKKLLMVGTIDGTAAI